MKQKEVTFKYLFSGLMPVLIGSAAFLAFMSFNLYEGYLDLNLYSQAVMLGAGAIVFLTSAIRLFIPVVVINEEGILIKRIFRRSDLIGWADVTGFKIVERKAANTKRANKFPSYCVLVTTVHSKVWYPTDDDFVGFNSEGHRIQIGQKQEDHTTLIETLEQYHQAYNENR